MSFSDTNAVIYYQIPKQDWDDIIGELKEIRKVIQDNYTVRKKRVVEFAKVIGVSSKTIHRWIDGGILESKCKERDFRVLEHYREGAFHFVRFIKE